MTRTRLYALEGSGVGHAIALALSGSVWYTTLLENYQTRTLATWIESELKVASNLPILKRHVLPCWRSTNTTQPQCESGHQCGFDHHFTAQDRIFISTGINWTQNIRGNLPSNANNHTDQWCHTQFERLAEGLSVEPCTYPVSKHKIIDRINAYWPTLPVFSADAEQIISAPWIYDTELDPTDVEQLCESLKCKFNWPNAVSLHNAYLQARTR